MVNRKQEGAAAGRPGWIAPMPWWLQAVVVLGSLLFAMGGVIAIVHPAMLAPAGTAINGAVRVYAGYVSARNLAISLSLVLALLIGARTALSSFMALAGLIQFFDAVMDCAEGRWTLVPGILILSIAFFFAASRIAGHPLWKRAAWRDAKST